MNTHMQLYKSLLRGGREARAVAVGGELLLILLLIINM